MLREYTPCASASAHTVARALAVVHGELILIHPFRDGNGRVARFLAFLMGLQAGLPPLDFSPLLAEERQPYFDAIRSVVDRDSSTVDGHSVSSLSNGV